MLESIQMKENAPFLKAPEKTAGFLRDSLKKLVSLGKITDRMGLLDVVTQNGGRAILIDIDTNFAKLIRDGTRLEEDGMPPQTKIEEMAAKLFLTALTGRDPMNNGVWERTRGNLPCMGDFKDFEIERSLDRFYWYSDRRTEDREHEYPLKFTLKKADTA